MIAIIGLALAAFIWEFVPATAARGDIRVVSGELVDDPRVHQPMRSGAFATLRVRTPSGVVEGRVRDIGFIWSCGRHSFFWGCLEYDTLSRLKAGDRVSVGLIDLRGDAAHVFEIARDGEVILTFDQALTAHRRVRANLLTLGGSVAAGGVGLMLWGWVRRPRYRR